MKKGKSGDTVAPTKRFPHFDPNFVGETYQKYGSDKAMKFLVDLDYQNFIKKYPDCAILEKSYTMIETEGDLFTSSDSLAHCVSEDLRMGKGIAPLFVKAFGRVDELTKQKKKPGSVAYLVLKDRCVFYLITKWNYFNIPSYENLWLSLKDMATICLDNKVTALSMPVIACGLDRLEWKHVKDLIEKAFQKTGVQITIYVWKEK